MLLRALLVSYTAVLMQLARHAARDTSAKITRQYFTRWLSRPHWDPDQLYARLNRAGRRALAHGRSVPLLMDITDLSTQWSVLQVSFPWEGRALPLYRVVTAYVSPETERRTLVREALTFLGQHLPGRRGRSVLVADRGFPGHWLIKLLQKEGWRFVLRVTAAWKVTHPEFTGALKDGRGRAGVGESSAAAAAGSDVRSPG